MRKLIALSILLGAGSILQATPSCGYPDTCGFLYNAGSLTLVSAPGWADTFFVDINNVGQIVGYHTEGPSFFLYQAGSFTTFEVPGAYFTYPTDINDAGQILGYYGAAYNSPRTGFLYDAGTFTILEVPGAEQTVPTAMNNVGQVIGYYYTRVNGHLGGYNFLYDAGSFAPLSIQASGINDAGQLVGAVRVYSPNFHYVGYLSDAGSYTTIEVPGAFITDPLSINNAGQIVGNVSLPEPRSTLLLASGLTFLCFLGLRKRAHVDGSAAGNAQPTRAPHKDDGHVDMNGRPAQGQPASPATPVGRGYTMRKLIALSILLGAGSVLRAASTCSVPNYCGFLYDYHSGSFTVINVPESAYGSPRSNISRSNVSRINDLGQMVGSSTDGAFLYDAGSFTIFGDISVSFYDINNAGQIVGQKGSQGFLYDAGLYVDLPAQVPRGINDAGQIAGYGYGRNEDSFLYQAGSLTTIHAPGAQLAAMDINNPGQIVGDFVDHTGIHGFLYQDGSFTTIEVPKEIVGNVPSVIYPSGINNAGQIVGSFYVVPEPRSTLLLASGLTLLCFLGLRKRAPATGAQPATPCPPVPTSKRWAL